MDLLEEYKKHGLQGRKQSLKLPWNKYLEARITESILLNQKRNDAILSAIHELINDLIQENERHQKLSSSIIEILNSEDPKIK